MKNLALAAVTLALLSGTAFAQPHEDHRGGPAGHGPGGPGAPAAHAPVAHNPAPIAMHQDHHSGFAGPAMNNHPAPAPVPAAPVLHDRRPDNHAGPAMINRQAVHPGMAMHADPSGHGRGPGDRSGAGGGRRHLPPGIRAPRGHDRAPMWRGRSWAIGDSFYFGGFDGPTISDFDSYDLPPPRRGTHWIYVDGWFLMVGNRTGHIFAEIPADY